MHRITFTMIEIKQKRKSAEINLIRSEIHHNRSKFDDRAKFEEDSSLSDTTMVLVEVTKNMCKYCFDVLIAELENKDPPNVPEELVNEKAPLFVTWQKKSGYSDEYDLRGCIGNFGNLPLKKAVAEYALISALEDSRFSPVSRKEVPFLQVAISILVNFEKVDNIKDWTVGVHGIRIEFVDPHGRHLGGTYLPEVASEQGWTIDETLESLIRKAGYRGKIDQKLLDTMKLERYQSIKGKLTYEEYSSM